MPKDAEPAALCLESLRAPVKLTIYLVWCNESHVQRSASIRSHKRLGTSETEGKLAATSRNDQSAVGPPTALREESGVLGKPKIVPSIVRQFNDGV